MSSGSSNSLIPTTTAGYDEPINEELKYLYISNVKVSNFVSVKLLDKSDYTIWKKQMLCLLDSYSLRGLVVNTQDNLPKGFLSSPNLMRQYISLVQGWIYGSLSKDMLKLLIHVNGAPYEIWSALEMICGPPQDYPIDPFNELPEYWGHFHADYEPVINEEKLRYRYASKVKYSSFVSVRLVTRSNYAIWRKQMLRFLDSENLRGFVDATIDLPEVENPDIIERYESLVKDWILRSLDEDIQLQVRGYDGNLRSIWKELEYFYLKEEEETNADLRNQVQDVLFPRQMQVTTTLPSSLHNSIRNNKLVKAVVDGRWLEAKLMLDKDVVPEALTDGAVKEGRNDFLERLLDFINDENKIKVSNNGWTALHEAACKNNKHAAQLLVKECKSLLFCLYERKTPLEIAYRENKLDTFLYLWEALKDEQGTREARDMVKRYEVGIRNTIGFEMLEEAISKQQYGLASRLVNAFPQVAMQDDQLLMAMARYFPSNLGFGEALICPSLKTFHQRIIKRSSSLFNSPGALYTWADNVLWATRSLKEAMWLLQDTVFISLVVPAVVLYPLYQLIRLLILVILYPFFMLYFLLWKALANISGMPIKSIEKKRKIYQEAKDFVNIICNHIDKLGPFGTNHPCYSKPFLEAACQGTYEVFDEILSRSPKLLSYKSEEGHNCVQLAITNRTEKIYNLIHHVKVIRNEYKEFEDSFRNNILHLAGKLAPERILSRTTGAALQLQRELQWFREVEKIMLPGDLVKKNVDMETPQIVFSKQHADLVKEGEQWMKTTSEACSITAALIVTIVFAAAITVPGGNDEGGIPLFKKDTAFIIFAVCNAISLFSAASSLLVFLSILTTRFAEMDFLVSLPRRVIIGLSTLFLSTASMMVAFSAILFMVFCDERLWMLAPIGGLTCMPVAVIVTLQLPLLVDLFTSTYIPIFGKQKYIDSSIFISNHPLFAYE